MLRLLTVAVRLCARDRGDTGPASRGGPWPPTIGAVPRDGGTPCSHPPLKRVDRDTPPASAPLAREHAGDERATDRLPGWRPSMDSTDSRSRTWPTRSAEELVIEPAGETATGVPRLRAYIERFLDHVEEGIFPGGCFFVSAVSELDTHPGPVRDGAMAFSERWLTLLAEEVAAGQAAGELDPAGDPPQIAFELNAFMVLGNIQFVASADRVALDRVRRGVDTRLVALAPQRSRGRNRPNRSNHVGA